MIRFVFVILLSFISLNSWAKEKRSELLILPPSEWLSTVPAATQIDGYSDINSNWNNDFIITQLENHIWLEINPFDGAILDFDCSVELTLSIKHFSFPDGNITEETHTLSVEYDTAPHAQYKKIDIIKLTGGQKVMLTITDVNYNGLSQAQIDLLEDKLFFKAQTVDTRYYKKSAFSSISNNSISMSSTNGTSYFVTWPEVEAAEEYDVEFMFVDIYQGGTDASTDELIPEIDGPLNVDIFQNNYTRLVTDVNAIELPLLNEKSVYLIRVRPVGRQGENFELRYEHDFVGSLGFNVDAHENDELNYQSITTYAEHGKFKTVNEYFDGRMSSRQKVTKLQSNNYALIQESLYDNIGRKVIEILPGPAKDGQLNYYRNFSRNPDGNPYGPEDFEPLDDTGMPMCNPEPRPMSTTIGASKYYSPEFYAGLSLNEQKSELARIPDAFGYPFSQTKFMNDNTNRPLAQGGVGQDHIIGSGHETEITYSTPTQAELDRLFGTEVGYARYYKKVITEDPNDQVSIAYQDLKGNTIATSLWGEASNLETLETYDPVLMDDDLTVFTEIDSQDYVIITDKDFFVPENNKEYIFDYSFTPAQYIDETCEAASLCYDCIYDIVIEIINTDCNTMVLSGKETVGFIGPQDGTAASINNSCMAPIESWVANSDMSDYVRDPKQLAPEILTVTLDKGNYLMKKRLIVNEEAADLYVEDFISDPSNLCIQEKLDEIITQVEEDLSDSACEVFCEDVDYNIEEYPYCDTIVNKCEEAEKAMLIDMSPGGQYAKFEFDANGDLFSDDPLSIFHDNNILGDGNTFLDITQFTYEYTDIYGDQVTFDFGSQSLLEFATVYWVSEWAKTLMDYHPEKCYLDNCDYGAADFEGKLLATNHLTGAFENEFLDSDNPIDLEFLVDKDPFFIGITLYDNEIRADLDNYFRAYPPVPTPPTMTVYDLAVETTCKSIAYDLDLAQINQSIFNNCMQEISLDLTSPHADRLWINLRGYYLGLREKYMYTQRTAAAKIGGCYNGCIGVDTFNFFRDDFESFFLNPNNDQICGLPEFIHYKNKLSRFAGIYHLDSVNEMDDLWDNSNIVENSQTIVDAAVNHMTDSLGCVIEGEVDLEEYINNLPDDRSDCQDYNAALKIFLLDLIQLEEGQSILNQNASWQKSNSKLCNNEISAYEIDFNSNQGVILRHELEPGSYLNRDAENHVIVYSQDFSYACDFIFPAGDYSNIIEVTDISYSHIDDNYEVTLSSIDGTEVIISLQGCLQNCCMDNIGEPQQSCHDYKCLTELPDFLNQFQIGELGDIDSPVEDWEIGLRPNLDLKSYLFSTSGLGSLQVEIPSCFKGSPFIEYNFTMTTANENYISGYIGSDSADPQLATFELQLSPVDGYDYSIGGKQDLGRFYFRSTLGDFKLVTDQLDDNGESIHFSATAYSHLGWVMGIGEGIIPIKVTGSISSANLGRCCVDDIDSALDACLDIPNVDDPQTLDEELWIGAANPYFDPLWIKNPCLPDPSYIQDTIKEPYLQLICFEDPECCAPPDSIIFNEIVPYTCDEYMQDLITHNANTLFEQYLEEKKKEIKHDYMLHCLSAAETFTMRHENGEHHFVLSYYDQAGNLTRTVPPNGTYDYDNNTDVTFADANELAAVEAARSNSQTLKPDYAQWDTRYTYNTLNQITTQNLPDHGTAGPSRDDGVTKFIYDELGRLTHSQNPQQKPSGLFSYTEYDELGRIVESGQMDTPGQNYYNQANVFPTISTPTPSTPSPPTGGPPPPGGGGGANPPTWNPSTGTAGPQGPSSGPMSGILGPILGIPNNIMQVIWQSIMNQINVVVTLDPIVKEQITHTYYDEGADSDIQSEFPEDQQNNLRSRVAYAAYYDDEQQLLREKPVTATYYSYDELGNVESLLQTLRPKSNSTAIGRYRKLIEYDYDLVSGNVNKVIYQRAQEDQFMHRYNYDADNRITHVQTSTEGSHWETDARYFYYPHGPLARTELGENEVQGLDYTYTIHGWIKGVNSVSLLPEHDPGNDGLSSGMHSSFAPDEMGYMLSYYNGDYNSIAGNQSFVPDYNGIASELFNGNIRNMTTSIGHFIRENDSYGYVTNDYSYDQLNRIKEMRPYDDFNPESNLWSFSSVSDWSSRPYYTNYSYDGNGNIESLQRNGSPQQPRMDQLSYNYNNGNNQLSSVNDAVAPSNYPIASDPEPIYDIDTQGDDNYSYDLIGNLKEDKLEGLTMEWNVSGKVRKITDNNGLPNQASPPAGLSKNIEMVYDPLGNRVAKVVDKLATYYIRDAQGNILTTYEQDFRPNILVDVERPMTWQSSYIYGSSRIGEYHTDKILIPEDQDEIESSTSFLERKTDQRPSSISNVVGQRLSNKLLSYHLWNNLEILDEKAKNQSVISYITASKKKYELPNHLSNVIVVISDRVQNGQVQDFGNSDFTQTAEIKSASDYFPYGLPLCSRNMNSDYIFQYNSQLNLSEIYEGHLTAKYWEYDSRLARRWNIDPKSDVDFSPFNCLYGNPIYFMDVKGDKPTKKESASMSAHVYGDKKDSVLQGGWQVSKRDFGIKTNDETSGFKSQVYEREIGGKMEYAYAFAGTEDLDADLDADVFQVVGLSKQYDLAMDNSKKISNILDKSGSELTFTGHSLGGGLAAASTYATGKKSITFNAAGVSGMTIDLEENRTSNIDAVTMLFDPLNLFLNGVVGPELNQGSRTFVIPTSSSSVINGHSINNILREYNINPDLHRVEYIHRATLQRNSGLDNFYMPPIMVFDVIR